MTEEEEMEKLKIIQNKVMDYLLVLPEYRLLHLTGMLKIIR